MTKVPPNFNNYSDFCTLDQFYMDFLVKYKLTFFGILIGAIGGYIYYHFIGCASGTCSITSQPVNSTVYGAMMGGLLLNSFQGTKPKKNN